MRNRRFLHFEKPDSAQPPALNGQILATTYMSSLEDKSLMALYYGLTDPGETERATAQLPRVFDHLYCKLERLCDKKSAQPARRRTVAISWEETDELLLEINANICATRESSSAKENSATEHASSPAAAAKSHARPCIAETNPATESAWSQGHSNRTSTN